jgi:hypothetical protein
MSRDRVSTETPAPDDAVRVAQCLINDFTALVAVFDRQEGRECLHCGRDRDATSDARRAAERGRELSERLVELLSKND